MHFRIVQKKKQAVVLAVFSGPFLCSWRDIFTARTELKTWCANVVNRWLTTRVKVNRQCVLHVLYRMCGEKKSESGVKRAKWPSVRTEYVLQCHSTPLILEIGQTIKTCMHSMWGWMNELRVTCEVWSTEVCEVSLTKNLRGKPAKIRLGKV